VVVPHFTHTLLFLCHTLTHSGRLEDCRARVLLTCSGVMRGTKLIGLKQIADKACDLAAQQGHKVSPTYLPTSYPPRQPVGNHRTWRDGVMAGVVTRVDVSASATVMCCR
jgi:acyl-coenzyme A synthetase/AMP-(fatty) acid ligase